MVKIGKAGKWWSIFPVGIRGLSSVKEQHERGIATNAFGE